MYFVVQLTKSTAIYIENIVHKYGSANLKTCFWPELSLDWTKKITLDYYSSRVFELMLCQVSSYSDCCLYKNRSEYS